MTDLKRGTDQSLRKGLISWAIKGVMYKAYVGVVLMLSAGRWDWGAGWLYVFIFLAFDAATALVVIPRAPNLLIERSRRTPNVKSWDKVVMPLAAGILPLAGWILAGLNERWGWGPSISQGIQLVGFLLTVVGHGIIVWAMGANAFFSPMVRIQEERGHRVADGGPYRIIRHPGYVGAILFSLGIPLLLESWWALIPGLLSVALYILRTALEDQTLKEELSGYDDYASLVIYKLIPGVW
jgi:protein-S-isoprenylcysteine O-methyltransferase Ste14